MSGGWALHLLGRDGVVRMANTAGFELLIGALASECWKSGVGGRIFAPRVVQHSRELLSPWGG